MNAKVKSRRQMAQEEGEKKKRLPDLAGFFILFTQIYPSIVLLGYISGFMDVQLDKLASDSISAGLDIVLLTVACICAVIGPFASWFAKKYLED